MFQVHLVLHQFDDTQEQVSITQPAEHIFEDAQIFILHTLRDTVRERSEYHDRDIRKSTFDGAGNVEHIVAVVTRHTDDQLELCATHQFSCLVLVCCTEEAGRIAQSQFRVLIKYLLINTAIVLQHEGIVRVGHNQHIENTTCHQLHKRRILQYQLILFHRQLCNFAAKLQKKDKKRPIL